MLKRIATILILSLFIVVLAFPVVVAQDEEDVTLRWRTRPDNQAAIDVYTAASENIDENWDGVSLVYEPGGSETEDYQVVLITELEAGTAPDVFWIPGADIATFAETGLIANMAPYAAEDEDFNIEDFYAGPMSFLTTPVEEGEEVLWGLPRDVSAFALYYNKELFDEAGLDYPGESGDWTWDEFADTSEEISGLGDEIFGFAQNAWWGPWGYWVNAAGSGFFNEDFTACGLDNEATVEGLNAAAELYDEGWALPYGSDGEGPFLAGTIGMFMNGRWATPATIANADFDWDVAPLPAGPAGESNWLFWGAYVVNGNTEHPEEAWDLLTRLTSAEIQGQIASLGANIPSRQTQDAVDLFLNTVPEAGINNQVFVDGASVGIAEAPLFTGNWPGIRDAYGAAVTQVFNGELSAEEFAETICDQVAPFFDE